jgi:integrase
MYKPKNYYTLFKKEGIWSYACYTQDGKRVQRSTGRKKRAEAIEVINERIATDRLVYPIGFSSHSSRPVAPQLNPTFREYAEPFFDYDRCPLVQDALARGASPSRTFANNCRGSFLKHVLPAFGNTLLKEMNRGQINSWFLSLPSQGGISAVHANKVFRLLVKVLDRAVFDGLLAENPCKGLKPLHEEKSDRDAFTTEEVRIILASEHFRYPMARLGCYIAASTGMRNSEIRALKEKQIFPDHILVDASESQLDGRKAPKNGESREVPITPALYEAIRPYLHGDPEQYLFTFNGIIPVQRAFFNNCLQEVLKAEGIERKGLVFHSFRCYIDTQLISEGANPETVRLMLGHKSEEMTKKYLHPKAEDRLALVGDQLEKIDGLYQGDTLKPNVPTNLSV